MEDNAKNIKTSLLLLNTGQIEGLPQNPRFIRDENFEKLKKSIKESTEFLKYRELIVYPLVDKFVVICGNMRLRACKELGMKEIPCKILPVETTADKLREYTIKDNVEFGEDDFDIMANEWDEKELEDWGVVPNYCEDDEEKEQKNENESKFIVEIICKDQEEQNKAFCKFNSLGYECKMK